jgi:hypothetical protein
MQKLFDAFPEFSPPVPLKGFSHHLDDDDIVLMLGSSMRPTPPCGSARVGASPPKSLVQLGLNSMQGIFRKLISVIYPPMAGEPERDTWLLARPTQLRLKLSLLLFPPRDFSL